MQSCFCGKQPQIQLTVTDGSVISTISIILFDKAWCYHKWAMLTNTVNYLSTTSKSWCFSSVRHLPKTDNVSELKFLLIHYLKIMQLS